MMYLHIIVYLLASGVSCMTKSNKHQDPTSRVPNHCMLDVAIGTCQDPTTNYFFNVTASYCQPFTYNGCGGNWNRFTTQAECTKTCTCTLPPETGPCKGYEGRWFYSPADGYCKPFMYGGCGGNSNSYLTWHDCSEQCGYPASNSTWWTSGAEWSNATSSKPNATSTSSTDKLMNDLMLWMMLANGEFEIEDFASLLAQAQMLRYARMGGSRSGNAGANSLFGSQMPTQDLASVMAGGFIDADFMEGRQGATNWGMAGSRRGSFTPLGQVGSVDNVLLNNNIHGMETSEFSFWNPMNAQSNGMGQFGSATGNIMDGNIAEAAMFGQGQFANGNQAMNFGASGNTNFGMQTEATGQASQSMTSSMMGSGFPQFDNVALEILYYIQKIGSGELTQQDLVNVGKKFGAVSPNGKVNIKLLATEMVNALRGSNSSFKMADIENIAKSMGAFDNKGNINVPMFVDSMMQKMSNNRVSEIFGKKRPSTNEFNWLTKRADVKRTRIGSIGGGTGDSLNQGQSRIGDTFGGSLFDMARSGSEGTVRTSSSRRGIPNSVNVNERRVFSMSGSGAPSGQQNTIFSSQGRGLSGNMNRLNSFGNDQGLNKGSNNALLGALGIQPAGAHGTAMGFGEGIRSSFLSRQGTRSATGVSELNRRGNQGISEGGMSGRFEMNGVGRDLGGQGAVSSSRREGGVGNQALSGGRISGRGVSGMEGALGRQEGLSLGGRGGGVGNQGLGGGRMLSRGGVDGMGGTLGRQDGMSLGGRGGGVSNQGLGGGRMLGRGGVDGMGGTLGRHDGMSLGGRGGGVGNQGLDGGSLSGRGGIDGLRRALGGPDGIALTLDGKGFSGGDLNKALSAAGLNLGKAITVVRAGKSASMGSYGKK